MKPNPFNVGDIVRNVATGRCGVVMEIKKGRFGDFIRVQYDNGYGTLAHHTQFVAEKGGEQWN